MAEASQPTGETSVDFNRFSPYGPGSDADATRQAQHDRSNDSPTDVNMNAIVARSQALTVDGMGKGFASNQDRRDKIADQKLMEHKPA